MFITGFALVLFGWALVYHSSTPARSKGVHYPTRLQQWKLVSFNVYTTDLGEEGVETLVRIRGCSNGKPRASHGALQTYRRCPRTLPLVLAPVATTVCSRSATTGTSTAVGPHSPTLGTHRCPSARCTTPHSGGIILKGVRPFPTRCFAEFAPSGHSFANAVADGCHELQRCHLGPPCDLPCRLGRHCRDRDRRKLRRHQIASHASQSDRPNQNHAATNIRTNRSRGRANHLDRSNSRVRQTHRRLFQSCRFELRRSRVASKN